MRVVLDTNVVISALLHDGPTRRFRELWQTAGIRPLVSQEMLEEYVRVLNYPKFGYGTEMVAGIVQASLLPWIRKVEAAKGRLKHPPKDPKDAMFLAAALGGRTKALVSGDPHLTGLNGLYSFPILKPAAFLDRYFPG